MSTIESHPQINQTQLKSSKPSHGHICTLNRELCLERPHIFEECMRTGEELSHCSQQGQEDQVRQIAVRHGEHFENGEVGRKNNVSFLEVNADLKHMIRSSESSRFQKLVRIDVWGVEL